MEEIQNDKYEPQDILLENKLLSPAQCDNFEVDLLLDAIYKQYGYDFHHYAKSSLKRRIANCMTREKKKFISELLPCILHDPYFFDRFLQDMSITVTSMFRDPDLFKILRQQVIPKLSTYPSINIWHAGCATGEEVYSMAILLHEAGLLERSRIYATDYNNQSLKIAESAIYPLESLREYSENYHQSGGKASFLDYFTTDNKSAKFNSNLRDKITFAHHNLMKDGVFAQMNFVLCRNVLIYFDKVLQDRALNILNDSLIPRGFLMLGDRESIEFTNVSGDFENFVKRSRIYRKKLFSPKV